MDFIPIDGPQKKAMLDSMGIKDIDELFSLQKKLGILLESPLNIDNGMTEQEVSAHVSELASKNGTDMASFLGAGAYRHYIPSTVDHVVKRSEFFTAYTPYQPEVSQGSLHTIFEFQSLIAGLTGMDLANASMYDGASATAEAAIMAHHKNGKKDFVIASTLHPHYKKTLETYGESGSFSLRYADHENGIVDAEKISSMITDKTSAVIIQTPNFFGCPEDVKKIAEIAHEKGCIMIITVLEPTSLAFLDTSMADIVVGEGQSFGNGVSYGGPYVGFMSCKKDLMRMMPGRLAGKTADAEGNPGYILTLQAREQHIRRDKATSNICTNQALCALAATVALATLGKDGLIQMAEKNLEMSHLAATKLASKGINTVFTGPFYNEFVVKVPNLSKKIEKLEESGIIGGFRLQDDFKEMEDNLLICVTEMNTPEQINLLADILGGDQ